MIVLSRIGAFVMASGLAAPAVTGMPRLLLRLEGAGLGVLACLAYWRIGESGWLFAALILAPDLSFLAYLAGPRIGAVVYNGVHTLLGPILVALWGLTFATDQPFYFAVSLVWAAHIGFDRMLGYGLKYPDGFAFTHLGRIGRAASPQ
jgi:Domain of unknown function (DUF4260)